MMKDEEHRLLGDEVKLLRSEGNKMQAFWEGQFNQWVKEKKSLSDEISANREALTTVESYYQDATEMRNQEVSILK